MIKAPWLWSLEDEGQSPSKIQNITKSYSSVPP